MRFLNLMILKKKFDHIHIFNNNEHSNKGDMMCYLIAMIFYLFFYLFGLVLEYFPFHLYDFILFFLFLLGYRYVILFLKKYYFIADMITTLFIVISFHFFYSELSLCIFFFMMYFICLESFTYTCLDTSKDDKH